MGHVERVCGGVGQPRCAASLVRWVLAVVPAGCALLATLLVVGMDLSDSSLEGGEEGPIISQRLLPSNKGFEAKQSLKDGSAEGGVFVRGESQGVGPMGHVDVPRRRGRAGGGRGLWEGDEEIEGSDEVAARDWWMLLNDAMVGRWGSLRSNRLQ